MIHQSDQECFRLLFAKNAMHNFVANNNSLKSDWLKCLGWMGHSYAGGERGVDWSRIEVVGKGLMQKLWTKQGYDRWWEGRKGSNLGRRSTNKALSLEWAWSDNSTSHKPMTIAGKQWGAKLGALRLKPGNRRCLTPWSSPTDSSGRSLCAGE